MLMHRASSRVSNKPSRDTPMMESTETLQSRHHHPDLKLFETNGALSRVDAVLLRSNVRKHTLGLNTPGGDEGPSPVDPTLVGETTAAGDPPYVLCDMMQLVM
ncbi:hypothetical protein PoMZ_10413 [Pyricularia oryzae]|uniref:Uncharacterized protein n=1 Tax=Pyricularia oryzae TaxID=318829 RepID=A0A4P7N443_PYROR|nr:hypothetical protein PoMZ_10413 [Pyricularia oryzae]